MKWLQIRIVHRILATNIVLKEMGVKANDLCTFCEDERDSIDHVFWKCNYARLYWTGLENAIHVSCAHAVNFKFTEKLVLFGTDDNIRTDHVIDFIIVLAKSFLYSCKLNNRIPFFNEFRKHLQSRFKIEEYNAKLYMNVNNFRNNWVYYMPLIND